MLKSFLTIPEVINIDKQDDQGHKMDPTTIKLFLPLCDPSELRIAEISNGFGKVIACPTLISPTLNTTKEGIRNKGIKGPE